MAAFSGSLGSRRINDAVRELVVRWADRSDLAVRHVIGRNGFSAGLDAPPELPEGGLAYQVVDYEDRMHLLLDAAAVGVPRAGGGVFELMATGLPAVLVPLPIATRDHQTANARAVEALGGAVVVPDAELDVDRLERELGALLDDRARLAAMSTAMRSGALVDAAERAARVVEGAARG
ncbi:MAG: glycosyltransferase [Acidimicrobiales bacterium]